MLKLKGITKKYHISEEHTVYGLNDLSIEFNNKGLVFVTGKSGSGKTTLLNTLGGLDTPTAGSLYFNNEIVFNQDTDKYDDYLNNHVSFVFQEYNLLEEFTVKENLLLANPNITSHELSKILKDVGLSGYEERLPSQLSSGQKQRISICRALVKKSSIILADEPTGALDSDTSIEIIKILKELSKTKLVIVVTHDTETAMVYGDRVLMISDGILEGDELLNKENLEIDSSVNDYFVRDDKKPYNTFFKIGLKSIFRHKIRLIITILMSVISISSFAVLNSLSSFDTVDNSIIAMEKNNITSLTIQNRNRHMDDLGRDQLFDSGFTEKEVEMYEESLDSKLVPIYNYYDIDFRSFLFDSRTERDNLYYNQAEITGFVSYDAEFINQAQFEIIAGKVPEYNELYNEVVITKHTYDMLKDFGVEKNGQRLNINAYSDVLGLNFTRENDDFYIVGILDTNFNSDYFKRIYEIEDLWSFEGRISKYEIEEMNSYNFHNILFTHKTFIESKQNSVFELNNPMVIDFDGSYDFSVYENFGRSQKISSDLNVVDNVQWFTDGKSELRDNEIVIPLSMLDTYIEYNDIGLYSTLAYDRASGLVDNYVNTNFAAIKERFDGLYFPYHTARDYGYYIINNDINNYDEAMTRGYFFKIANQSIIDEYYIDEFESAEFKYTSYNKTFLYDFEVVGYYDDIFSDVQNPGVILMSDTSYNDLLDISDSHISLIGLSTKSSSDVEKLLKIHFSDHEDGEWIEVNNEVTSTFDYLGNVIYSLSNMISYVSIVVLIFSSVILVNLIVLTINERKKDIGILMTMGYSRKDINIIFLIESMLIALMVFLISTLVVGVSNVILNMLLEKNIKSVIVGLNIGFIQIILILMISLLSSLIAYFISVYKIKSLKPVDIIKSL
jgi:ABC-type lipoprotein export system ATPase subunit